MCIVTKRQQHNSWQFPCTEGTVDSFIFAFLLQKFSMRWLLVMQTLNTIYKNNKTAPKEKNKLWKTRHVWLLAIAGTPSCVGKAFVVFQELRVIHLTWQVVIEYHFCFGVCINIPPSTKTNSSQTQHYLCNWANIINRKLRGLGQLEYVLHLRLSTGAPTPALNAMEFMWLDVKDKWLLTCHFAVTNLDFLISVSGQGKWLHSLSHEMRSLMCSFKYLQMWDGIRYLYSACELTVEKLNPYVTSIPLYFPTSDKAVGQILLQSCAFSSKDIQFCFFF